MVGLIILLILLWAACGYAIIRFYLRYDKRVTGGIVNHDPAMKSFLYAVDADRAAVIARLSLQLMTDALAHSFDADSGILTVWRNFDRQRYRVELTEAPPRTIVRVDTLTSMPSGGRLAYAINGFLLAKLEAVPIAYFPRSEE